MGDQAVLAALSAGVARSGNARSLAVVIRTPNLRRLLATTGELGPYCRRPEKKAGGKVLCAGSFEKTWPALTGPRRRRSRRLCRA